jgi:hypothetical protein
VEQVPTLEVAAVDPPPFGEEILELINCILQPEMNPPVIRTNKMADESFRFIE